MRDTTLLQPSPILSQHFDSVALPPQLFRNAQTTHTRIFDPVLVFRHENEKLGEGVDCIHLTHDIIQCQAVVNTGINLRIP
jgi:hypothetical protein